MGAAWAAILLPLLLWLLAGPVVTRFSGAAALKSVANLAAFLSFAAWGINLVLASRIRPVERAFGGLERLYGLHRRIGVLVVALAAVHVVFLSLHAAGDALELFLPSAGWATFTGVIALGLLVGFVVASLSQRLSYSVFALVQRLLGAAFILGAVHTLAVHGTADSSLLLTIYIAVLTAAACVSLGYRVIGARLGTGRHRYRVGSVRRFGDDVLEVVLSPVDAALEFHAGQFVYVTLHQPGLRPESHPFTIASPPGEAAVRIVVKRLGDFTGSLMGLRPGCRAQLEGPFGHFWLRRELAGPQTWIAGGIGITPFLSWARSLDRSVAADLYYCTPGPDDAHFLDELYAIADRFPSFRVIPLRKQSLGHLTVDDLEAVNPAVARGEVFICGPRLLIDNLATGLRARGVPDHRIHSESFDFRRRARTPSPRRR